MASHINRDKRQANFGVGQALLSTRSWLNSEKRNRGTGRIKIIRSLSVGRPNSAQPHTDKGLYEDLYKFDVKKELQEHHFASFEQNKVQKKKLTKFDILMLNPKSLPRKAFVREDIALQEEVAVPKSQQEYEMDGEEEQRYSEEKQEEEIEYNKLVKDLFQPGNGLKIEKIQNADYENDIVKEHILKLRTGEDAIKFFAKYGNSTPIKFLNCYEDKSPNKGPYDLLIEHNMQNLANYPQYYTVSPTGIVRVYNNTAANILKKKQQGLSTTSEDTTEYISLSDWMKESTQFNIVSNIHLFKNFSAIKLFTFWRSNVKYKKFIKLRQSLVKNVFFCKPVFVDRVMTVNKALQDVHSQEIVNFYTSKNGQGPEQFLSDQRAALSKATAVFNNIYDSIIATLDDTLKKLKENKNEKLTSELEKINFGKQIKQKAIYLQKLEKKIKKLRDDLAREDFSKYRSFVRLINYMAVENLIEATNTCLTTIQIEVDKHQKSMGGLFATTAQFGQNSKTSGLSVQLSVSDEDILQNFEKTIRDIIESLKDVHKTLTSAQAENFRNDETGSHQLTGPDIEKTICDSVIYQNVRHFLDTKIKTDFKDAMKQVTNKFSSCIDIQEKNNLGPNQFIPENWRQETHPLKEIHEKINQWKIYKLTKDKDINDQGFGIFAVETRMMKKQLTDYIERCLTIFLDKLLEFYKTNAEKLFRELSEKHETLGKEFPETVTLKEYTKYIQEHEDAIARTEGIEAEKKDVEKAYALLTQNKIKLDVVDAKLKTKIESLQSGYAELLTKAGEKIELIKEKMVEKLESEKQENRTRVTNTLEKLDDSELTEMPTEPERVQNIEEEMDRAIELLDGINENIEFIKKTTAKLEGFTGKMVKKEKKEPGNPQFKQLEDKFTERNKLWRNLKSFEQNKKDWMNGEFLKLDSDEVEKTFKQYETDRDSAATKMSLLVKTKGTNDPVWTEMNRRLNLMRNWIPIIVSLGNKNLNENHWKQIFDRLSDPIKYKTNKEFSLQDLIDDNVMMAKEFIEEVSARASGEAKIEQDLNDIKRIWEENIFEVQPYNDSKDKYILSKTEEVVQMLDDHQAKIQSMMAQKYVVNIRPKVEDWENKLAMVQNTLDEWLECQRQWMYLENIFSAEDIQKELPGETAKFMGVDKFWKDTMSRTHQKPNVIEAAANKDIFEKFQDNNKVLEHVQKLLEDYLEKKRKAFPRFYFLTNDQLLEILSQTRNPHAVQPHMQKCFDNIKSIKFTEGQDSVDIYAMVSLDPEAEPETVQFTEMVKAVGLVEGWLRKIEEAMVVSLRHNTKQALVTYPGNDKKRAEWFFNWPAQSVLVVDMIMWTSLLEDSIQKFGQGNKDALNHAFEVIKVLIAEMVGLVKTDLSAAQRETIKSLIVLEVHNRDVTERIAELKVDHINNFEWAKQLRYYWDTEEDDCFARQTNTVFRYGYEYLGNGSRLVITQLTDKCYMTLTGALHLNFGGAPEGPAGTGKTETTKDLAKALAIQCIVFNCSGNLDYVLMARFFSGLAQCGAWACFDEFNRIETEVLSVIAQQILVIQNGIRDAASEIDFEGNLIRLNPRFGVFITMNPGYAGRKELPDNLKALFRPVAMMIPDYALIAEIILFSEGFLSARGLSRKMVYLYKLSSEQLSKQKHYDFGMRAVKSVLVMAGSLRRKVPKEEEESKEAVELEAEVLLKAMRDSNVPKFLQQDLPLFAGIIQDLFPGKNVPLDPHLAVRAAIITELEKKDLQKPDSFMLKIIQLLETMIVRHGVMTVGTTGTGKTTLTEILAKALTELSKSEEHSDPMFAEVKTFKLNPKSISEAELFGLNDVYTNTFTHGIVSKLITDALSVSNHIKKWFWFDGPVDAGWIENMNTVLDDNKMLCLPDGKRIKLPTSFTMLFEVQDLLVASPATVSRCGMVFLEPYNLGIDAIFETWKIHFLKEEEKEFIEKAKIKQIAGKGGAEKKVKKEEKDTPAAAAAITIEPTRLASGFAATIPLEKTFILMKEAFSVNLPKLRKGYKEEIPSVDLNLVKNCLNLFQVLYNHHKSVQENTKKNLIDSEKEQIYSFIFVFSFMWSIGGNIADSTKTRADFSREMRDYFNHLIPGLPKTDFYNYYIEFTTRKWEDWKSKVVPYHYEESVPFFRILVDTADTIRFKYILKTMNEASFNVLLMGNSGVGKSVIVKDYLYNLSKPINEDTPSTFLYATTTFSAQTSSTNVMNLFLDKLTARGRKLGPPSGKKMIFHIDDINMPKHDEFGAQPPCELLRQVIDQGGFYDLKKHTLKQVIETCMVASCSPPGGGRNVVSPRLFRQFHMLWMPDLSNQSMEVIFKSILKGFYTEDPNTSKHITTADELIKASVAVYQQVKTKLLPTPSKCHYTFNLRDMSKVIQGMIQMTYDKYTNVNDMIKLWIHEECRIFYDRLVNETDRAIWFDILLENLKLETGQEMTREQADNLIYTDIVDISTGYCEVTDMNELFQKAESYCTMYNSSSGGKRRLDLVFFTDALKHLCRISRVIKQPRGNCLLIGVGGSGRQSLTKVAKAVNNYDFFSIEITKNYKEQKWREDLGVLLKSAGKDNKKIVFLFSDTQIIYESFLEDINNILNTGEVPNLWKQEDIDQICQDLRGLAAQQGREETKDSLMELFVHQVRENLHICLAFSPVGGKLIERCRQFPSIIDCCTIDWFERWPEEALNSVAISQITKTADDTLVPQAETLAKIAVTMHNDVIENSDLFYEELKRKYYITPTSYLELLKTYIEMFRSEKNMIPFNIKKYSVGLEKLKDTNESVKILQDEIIKYQPILDQKAKETEIMKIDLEKQTVVANQVEESVSFEAAAAQKTRDEVNELKTNCEIEIEKARPALEKAQKAANSLDSNDIAEIKAAKKPTDTMREVIIAVAMIFGVKENWDDARKFMCQTDTIKRLRTLNPLEDVPEKLWKRLRSNYLDKFKLEELQKASKALATLFDFMNNSEAYFYCQKTYEPKVIALKEAQETLAKVEAELAEKQAKLTEIQEKVGGLNRKLEESKNESESLKRQQENSKKKLTRAEKLLTGLADERIRWKETEESLNSKLHSLIGNMLMTSGILSYLGPFTAPFRKKLIKKWDGLIRENNIPFSKEYKLEEIEEAITIREWQNMGLPADELSVENGIMMTRCQRWPLMIDPQTQANRWIKNMRKDMGLNVIKLTNQNFVRTLSLALQTGGSLLIENVEETLDPILEPVLMREIVKEKGNSYKIKIGADEMQYNQDFKLYMTSKRPNPTYSPEIVIKVTLINFTVTPGGLEDQLLIDVIKNEKPELEEERDALIVKISDYNRKLKELQDKILRQINESQDDILENDEIIITLEASKLASQTINKGMEDAKATAEKINISREKYRPIAQRGSILYFVIAGLALIDSMYQYSLEFFIGLFNRRLMNSEKSEDISQRVSIVIKDITESFYRNICRGLFEKHKLMYSFLIATSIAIASDKITHKEWQYFSMGSYGELLDEKDKPEYMSDQIWRLCKNLEKLSYTMASLGESMLHPEESGTWKQLMQSENPLEVPLPPSIEAGNSLSQFQRMLIYYTLSKEKLILFIKEFVKNYLGKEFIESPPFNLKSSFDDSSANTPIIFVLSPGADPMTNLMNFAKELDMDGRFRVLSLGQGQGPKAEDLIKMGRINGDWICLQNCHLAASWMPDLERIQENQGDVLQDYRLWLTSMPAEEFPVSVLQSGIKITNEPPRGIKANIKRTYLETDDDWYNRSSKPEEFKTLLFSLSLFHAVILERKKFGAIGWNIPYGWMSSDLDTCRQQLKMYLDQQDTVPYETLSFLIAVINYGGRVTDKQDERLIKSILKLYITPDVMKPGYKFSDSGIYRVPEDLSLVGIRNYIEDMPLEDGPEVLKGLTQIFGLHANANITYQINQVKEFLDTFIMAQPRGGGKAKGGETPEQYVTRMVQDFLHKAQKPMKYELDPTTAGSLHIFRGQELDRFNKLVVVIEKSLKVLQLAIDGYEVMSSELELMFNNIMIKKVPPNWNKWAYPSLKPLASWYEDLVERINFFKVWLEKDQMPSYWVSSFFFPQGFMTAVLQTYARKEIIPIDELVFQTKMLDKDPAEITEIPENGVNIHGMYLEGCSWDRRGHSLEESEKKKLFQLMPSIYIVPVKLSTYDPRGTYPCPVYKTSIRQGELTTTGLSSNFVLFLDLPSQASTDHWVRRGVALLLQTDD